MRQAAIRNMWVFERTQDGKEIVVTAFDPERPWRCAY